MTTLRIIFLTAALFLALSCGCARKSVKSVKSAAPPTLLGHAGAGIRPALDDAAAVFTEQTGIKIEYNYKGSGCLLPDALLSGKGDVYIPGEEYYVKQAIDRELVEPGYKVVASMSTVIITRPGNPKNIQTLQDLTKPGIRLGIGDPEVVAVGRAAKETLTKAGVWDQVQPNKVMAALNVSELSNAVRLGNLDAAVVWNACAALYTKQDITTILILDKHSVTSTIPVGILKSSRHAREAQQYLDFLASAEGNRIFLKHGFGLPAAKAPGKA